MIFPSQASLFAQISSLSASEKPDPTSTVEYLYSHTSAPKVPAYLFVPSWNPTTFKSISNQLSNAFKYTQ